MNSKFPKQLLMAIISVAITSACNSSQKKTSDTTINSDSTVITTVTTDTLTQARKDWENFKTDAREKVKENNDSLEAFKAKTDKAGKKMKEKFDERIAQMKQKNDELKTRLDDFKEDSKEKWDKFRDDFKKDMDSLDLHLKELTAKNSK